MIGTFLGFKLFRISFYFTVTFTLTVFPFAVTEMVAVPFLTPLTTPLLVTVAIFLFEVLYVILLLGKAVAFNEAVLPFFNVIFVLGTDTTLFE